MCATARESNSTPRSPLEPHAGSSSISSSSSNRLPPQTTPLNNHNHNSANQRSGMSGDTATASAQASRSPPGWRCFVKGISSTHVLLVLLPASFKDLKQLAFGDRPLPTGHCPYIARVAPDSREQLNAQPGADFVAGKPAEDETKVLSSDGTWTCDENRWSESFSQPCSAGPTRTNSLDVSQQQQQQRRPRVASSDARIPVTRPLDEPQTSTTASESAFFANSSLRPVAPSSTSATGAAADSPICASVTLPVYVFDCPLSSLTVQLLAREKMAKEDLCRDHTFQEVEPAAGNVEEETKERVNSRADAQAHREPYANNDLETLSKYCSVIEALYCKCLGQALYTSLQRGRFIHSRDVQAAMDLCKETLLEVDITSFVHNICGHVKDFRMKSGIERIRQQQQQQQEQEQQQQQQPTEKDDKWLFPLSLLRLHQVHSTISSNNTSNFVDSFPNCSCSCSYSFSFCSLASA